MSPYALAKCYAFASFVMGLLAMALGFVLSKSPWSFLLGVLVAFLGFRLAVTNFRRLLHIGAAEATMRHDARGPLRREFRQRSLPQKLFLVLYTVAEIDGRAGEPVRNLVRQFLLERFLHPTVLAELLTWNADPLPRDQLGPMLHELRAQLSVSECETLFYWCCLVTLSDSRFSDREHDVLQFVSRNLGIQGRYARVLFLHAKSRVMSHTRFRTGGDRQHGQWSRTSTTPRAVSRREHALATLGLDASATEEDIRRRHRELVKKHHPDAHSRLGPVAQQEATERFREIQAAYELLTGR